MLKNKPPFNKIYQDILRFIENDVIIGHNVIFDVNFLKLAFARCNIEFNNKHIDTLSLSRKLLPNLKNHKLSTVVKYFKIRYDVKHRALADTLVTYEVYKKLKTNI